MYNVLDVSCPLCQAPVGQTCVTKSGKPFKRVGIPGLTSHVIRMETARKAGGPNTNMSTSGVGDVKMVTVTWTPADGVTNDAYIDLIKERAKAKAKVKKAKKGKGKGKKGKK